MLTARDVLAKSQKVTFLSQKNGFRCFFLVTAGDALSEIKKIIIYNSNYVK